jgi:hypothetical protein
LIRLYRDGSRTDTLVGHKFSTLTKIEDLEEYDKNKKRKKKLYEDLPDNYRPATSDDVPEGRACGNCMFFNESNLDEDGNAFCERWEEYVAGGNYCNAWKGREEASAPMSGKNGTAAKTAAATESKKKEEHMELKELSDQLAELPNLVAAAVAEALAPAPAEAPAPAPLLQLLSRLELADRLARGGSGLSLDTL